MKLSKFILLMAFAMLCTNPISAQKPQKATSEKTQCIATTKKGSRCKLEVVKGSKYCSVHFAQDPKAKRCKAITKKGTQCSRPAGSTGFCTQHSKR